VVLSLGLGIKTEFCGLGLGLALFGLDLVSFDLGLDLCCLVSITADMAHIVYKGSQLFNHICLYSPAAESHHPLSGG